MKYIRIAFLLVVLGPQNLWAQIGKETRFIELDAPAKEALLPSVLHYSGVRFIDNRIDTSCIAFIRNMCITSQTGKINFKGRLTDELNNYAYTNFKNSFSGTRDSLLVVINYFRLSSESDEFPGGIEPQFVKCSLLFARKQGGRVSLLSQCDTLLAFKRKPVSANYKESIKMAMTVILLKGNTLIDKAEADSTPGSPATYPETDFLRRYVSQPRLPILQDSTFKRGVYANFQQALLDSPQYPDYEPRYPNPSYYILVKDSNGAKVKWNNIWGYSDGKTIYVFSQLDDGLVYPLIREGNSLVISLANADTATDKTNARAINIVLLATAILSRGAIVGTAAGYGIDPPRITEKLGRKKHVAIGTEINMRTGEIEF